MDQTTQAGDIADTLETLERMAQSATETPDLAAFLAETAQLLRSLAERADWLENSRLTALSECMDALARTRDDLAAANRRLALYETP